MSLVLDAFAGSWDTAGMTLCQISDCSVRPIRRLSIVRQRQLRLYGHVARYPEADPACRVISVRHNPTWRRPGDAHKTLCCGKSMPPAGSHSVWEGSLHLDSQGVTARSGAVG